MKSSWKTNLQITANCLCDCRIKSCIQEYTVIQEEGQYTGKTQHNLPKDDKTTNCVSQITLCQLFSRTTSTSSAYLTEATNCQSAKLLSILKKLISIGELEVPGSQGKAGMES